MRSRPPGPAPRLVRRMANWRRWLSQAAGGFSGSRPTSWKISLFQNRRRSSALLADHGVPLAAGSLRLGDHQGGEAIHVVLVALDQVVQGDPQPLEGHGGDWKRSKSTTGGRDAGGRRGRMTGGEGGLALGGGVVLGAEGELEVGELAFHAVTWSLRPSSGPPHSSMGSSFLSRATGWPPSPAPPGPQAATPTIPSTAAPLERALRRLKSPRPAVVSLISLRSCAGFGAAAVASGCTCVRIVRRRILGYQCCPAVNATPSAGFALIPPSIETP